MTTDMERQQLLAQLSFLKDEREVLTKRLETRDDLIKDLETKVETLLERVGRLECSK